MTTDFHCVNKTYKHWDMYQTIFFNVLQKRNQFWNNVRVSKKNKNLNIFIFKCTNTFRSVCLTHIYSNSRWQYFILLHLALLTKKEKILQRWMCLKIKYIFTTTTKKKKTTSIGVWGSSLEEPLSHNAQTHKEDCKPQDFSASSRYGVCVCACVRGRLPAESVVGAEQVNSGCC